MSKGILELLHPVHTEQCMRTKREMDRRRETNIISDRQTEKQREREREREGGGGGGGSEILLIKLDK